MSKRITLSDSDLEVLRLILGWRINAENALNDGNARIGKMRVQELLDKLN